MSQINIKGSHFLDEDPLNFDAPFFSMTASEANGTDPQQRLMLEVAYEAMENGKSIISNSSSVVVANAWQLVFQ